MNLKTLLLLLFFGVAVIVVRSWRAFLNTF